MRKREFCLCKNKGADQLYSNCTADQRLCFRYTDSTIPLLLITKISSFYISVTVQAGLSDPVGNPKDRISCDKAHLFLKIKSNTKIYRHLLLCPFSSSSIHVICPIFLHMVHCPTPSPILVHGPKRPTLKVEKVFLNPLRVLTGITVISTVGFLIAKEVCYTPVSASGKRDNAQCDLC